MPGCTWESPGELLGLRMPETNPTDYSSVLGYKVPGHLHFQSVSCDGVWVESDWFDSELHLWELFEGPYAFWWIKQMSQSTYSYSLYLNMFFPHLHRYPASEEKKQTWYYFWLLALPKLVWTELLIVVGWGMGKMMLDISDRVCPTLMSLSFLPTEAVSLSFPFLPVLTGNRIWSGQGSIIQWVKCALACRDLLKSVGW